MRHNCPGPAHGSRTPRPCRHLSGGRVSVWPAGRKLRSEHPEQVQIPGPHRPRPCSSGHRTRSGYCSHCRQVSSLLLPCIMQCLSRCEAAVALHVWKCSWCSHGDRAGRLSCPERNRSLMLADSLACLLNLACVMSTWLCLHRRSPQVPQAGHLPAASRCMSCTFSQVQLVSSLGLNLSIGNLAALQKRIADSHACVPTQ